MPIETDSDAWADGEPSEPLTKNVLQFLADNAGTAFTPREIADEVIGTEFDKIEDNWELAALYEEGEIDEDAYEEKRHDVPTSADFSAKLYLEVRIRKLVEEDLVEVRQVDASETDAFTDLGTVPYYAYALE
ncbi:hypothetical protein ACLI4Z_01550 [Natrialbaceae archaeon A-arb3/5]